MAEFRIPIYSSKLGFPNPWHAVMPQLLKHSPGLNWCVVQVKGKILAIRLLLYLISKGEMVIIRVYGVAAFDGMGRFEKKE